MSVIPWRFSGLMYMLSKTSRQLGSPYLSFLHIVFDFYSFSCMSFCFVSAFFFFFETRSLSLSIALAVLELTL